MSPPNAKRLLTENGLASFMNDTKWRELCSAIDELPFPPAYQQKLLGMNLPEEDSSDYMRSWWGDWGRTPEFILGIHIEWIKILPRYRKSIGLLLEPIVIDCTDELRALLQRLRLPFVEKDGFFTVYGHASGVEFDNL